MSAKPRRSFSRRRHRPSVNMTFDHKDPELLRQFLTERGKIVPSRVSRLNRQQQRQLTAAIKRARQLALLPVTDQHQLRHD